MIVLTAILLVFGGLAWYFHDTSVKDVVGNNKGEITKMADEAKTKLSEELKEIRTTLVTENKKLTDLVSETKILINNKIDNDTANITNSITGNTVALIEVRNNLNVIYGKLTVQNDELKDLIIDANDNILANAQALADAKVAILSDTTTIITLLNGYKTRFDNIDSWMTNYYNEFVTFSQSAMAGVNGIYSSLSDARTELASVGTGVQNANNVINGNNLMLSQAMPLITGNNQMLGDAMPLITGNNQMLGNAMPLITGNNQILGDIQNVKLPAIQTQIGQLGLDLGSVHTALATSIANVQTNLYNAMQIDLGNVQTNLHAAIITDTTNILINIQQNIQTSVNAHVDAKFLQLCLALQTGGTIINCSGF
jgi:hypothetical protein